MMYWIDFGLDYAQDNLDNYSEIYKNNGSEVSNNLTCTAWCFYVNSLHIHQLFKKKFIKPCELNSIVIPILQIMTEAESG